MSFKFSWTDFSKEFYALAQSELTIALNRGIKPSNICGDIKVSELDMGHQPPELEILDIGELTSERTRMMFKCTYNGDAHIVLHTKVQVNPISIPNNHPGIIKQHKGMALKPLIVPMNLQIEKLELNGILSLVIDNSRGYIACNFKNDPLSKVVVRSSFDGIAMIRELLQREIETHLRHTFLEDLPEIIHNISKELFQKKSEIVGKRRRVFSSADVSKSNDFSVNNIKSYFSLSNIHKTLGGSEEGLATVIKHHRTISSMMPVKFSTSKARNPYSKVIVLGSNPSLLCVSTDDIKRWKHLIHVDEATPNSSTTSPFVTAPLFSPSSDDYDPFEEEHVKETLVQPKLPFEIPPTTAPRKRTRSLPNNLHSTEYTPVNLETKKSPMPKHSPKKSIVRRSVTGIDSPGIEQSSEFLDILNSRIRAITSSIVLPSWLTNKFTDSSDVDSLPSLSSVARRQTEIVTLMCQETSVFGRLKNLNYKSHSLAIYEPVYSNILLRIQVDWKFYDFNK